MGKQKQNKKKSIREFVSEDSIKFQLYLMKYSNLMKDLETKTKEDIIKDWEKGNNKRIKRFINDLENPKFQNEVAQTAIKSNIKYVKSLKPYVSLEDIKKDFEKKREEYITSLENRVKENKTNTLSLDKELLIYAKEVELTSNVSKEKFGIMLLLIIKNLGSMPGFLGYSDNWKTDFYSNAVEKTLLYLSNFDEHLLSKRTGAKSKAFAYITQISYNAFVNIIKERKKEGELLENTISLESSNIDGVRNQRVHEIKHQEDYNYNKLSITIKNIDQLNDKIEKAYIKINNINSILELNEALIIEIEDIKNNNIITEDVDLYIKDLESKIINVLENKVIDTLEVILPEESSIPNPELISRQEGIQLIITYDKPSKKEESVPKPEMEEINISKVNEENLEIKDLKDFNSEW